MAPRGRSAIASEDANHSYDSSPDPLAISMNENTPNVRRKTTSKEPLGTTSPSKQNRALNVMETDLSSPSKSMYMSTPRRGSASPWRIKVTVQAEPGSDENAESPSINRVTRTKTTIVPLKDHDAQSPAKRPRGRPRKSDVGAATKPKRRGTPVKRAAQSKSRDRSVGAAESSAADVDTDVPPKKRRGRPRKSVQPPTEDDETLVVQDLESPDDPFLDVTPAPASRSRATSSKKSTHFATSQVSVPAIETTDATPQPPPSEIPQGTPSQTELAQNSRARKGTPHSKKTVPVSDMSNGGSDEDSDVLTPTSGEEDSESQEANRHPSAQGATQEDLDTPSEEGPDDDEDAEVQDVTNFAFEEGGTRMPDDTIVLDSENFSMISVDSLHSNGGLSSPPKPEEAQNTAPRSIGSLLQHEYLQPPVDTSSRVRQTVDVPPPNSSHGLTGLGPNESVPPVSSSRYKTPVMDETPSVPPPIEPVPPIVPKTETPGLGRAVTAGVALQGLVDPSRTTPTPSRKGLDEERDRLDDLFRGFSEGTRREMQAGLRLGEQLAEGQTKELSSPTLPKPMKAQPEAAPKEGVFRTQRKYRQSRLLTPEDQDDHVITPVEQPATGNDVQYPTLDVAGVEKSLISPARSEEERSWHADAHPDAASGEQRRSENVVDEERDMTRHDELPVKAGASNDVEHSDIWQEEASRSSNSSEEEDLPTQESSKPQDLFMDVASAEPTRGKPLRTWRRKNMNNSQDSNEPEAPQQPTPPRTESAEPVPDRLGKGKAKMVEAPIHEDAQVEDEETSDISDGSDDTGMFFQANMPNVYKKKRSPGLRQKKEDEQSLSSLLEQGESLLPESSPPVMTKKSPSALKANPFLNTPPRFPGFPSSPVKSSPLRREIRGSDISSDSIRHVEDESSLPIIQSSPFRTFVDGESMASAASDQLQFRAEMEGSTASTIVRVREEADEYLDAYEPQERSLDGITEVTEPGRTIIASSPPQRRQSFSQSMLPPTRKPVPLLRPTQPLRPTQRSGEAPILGPGQAEEETEDEGTEESSVYADTEASSSPASQPNNVATPAEEPQAAPTGLFSRVTSTVAGAFSRPAPPAPHPILSRFNPLPKIEPWTKTHYKALDKLYTTHLKHLALFSPSISPPTPLSNTNGYLLRQFLAANKPCVGATFSAWGYSMVMTETLVVLCAVFMELLSLESIAEYERLTGRGIQLGDCVPGRTGDAIKGEEVMRRLATVILGEDVRRDEQAGKKIDRSQGLTIAWPR